MARAQPGNTGYVAAAERIANISEACSVSSDSSSSSTLNGGSSGGGGSGGSGGGSDYDYGYDYKSECFGIDASTDVALQAAAAGNYVASELEGQAFRGLSPRDLSSLAVSLARLRYGTDRCYRTMVSAATSHKTFSECAIPADWVKLWPWSGTGQTTRWYGVRQRR